jgi:hypothetical protein
MNTFVQILFILLTVICISSCIRYSALIMKSRKTKEYKNMRRNIIILIISIIFLVFGIWKSIESFSK